MPKFESTVDWGCLADHFGITVDEEIVDENVKTLRSEGIWRHPDEKEELFEGLENYDLLSFFKAKFFDRTDVRREIRRRKLKDFLWDAIIMPLVKSDELDVQVSIDVWAQENDVLRDTRDFIKQHVEDSFAASQEFWCVVLEIKRTWTFVMTVQRNLDELWY